MGHFALERRESWTGSAGRESDFVFARAAVKTRGAGLPRGKSGPVIDFDFRKLA
jgi:hypothetical protein